MKRILIFVVLFAFMLSGCSVFSDLIKPEDKISNIKPVLPPEPSLPAAETTPLEEPTDAPIVYETYYVVNCEESISLYSSADINSKVLCSIPFGASVSYIQTAENGFASIAYQGMTGYALAACLSSFPQEQETYTTYYVVNCNEFITLRAYPSTEANAVCRIPLGSSVSFVSTADNGFYKISYMGQTGYALASYLSQDPQAHSKPKDNDDHSHETYSTCYVVNCRESISLRSYPSTSADTYCQIPLGAAVSYIETASNGFYKVVYDGRTGYALASYLSFTKPAASEPADDSHPAEDQSRIINAINALLLGIHFQPDEYGIYVSDWSDSTIAHTMYTKLLWDGSSYLSSTGIEPRYAEDYHWHYDLALIQRITRDTLGREFPANTNLSYIYISGDELLIMPSAGESTVLTVYDITIDGDLVYAVGTAVFNDQMTSTNLGYFEAVLQKNPSSIYGYTLISLREITSD